MDGLKNFMLDYFWGSGKIGRFHYIRRLGTLILSIWGIAHIEQIPLIYPFVFLYYLFVCYGIKRIRDIHGSTPYHSVFLIFGLGWIYSVYLMIRPGRVFDNVQEPAISQSIQALKDERREHPLC